MEITIGQGSLASPVGVASGTFGYGSEYEELIDLSLIGALFAKSVTLKPREGNDIPRLVETPSGLINSIGLANVGIDHYIEEKLPYFRTLPCPVVANIAGADEDEYCALLERLDSEDGIWGYEANLSCPNVKHGLAFGTDPSGVERLTRKMRKCTKRPLIVKLTPNVTDIAGVASAAEAGGADAISCINTLVGMVIDIEKKKPVLPAGTGGLSGPAIRPVGIAAVYWVSRAVKIPVIGIGGIMCGDDAIQYLLAGASAIQVGTGNFVDPSTVSEVSASFDSYSERNNLKTVKDYHQFID
ncbi:MAG: dihydroorotate dehydrogenase [Spirochaetales bacterium]|jgi:dihydroorotate dehydrogenase (NAD+) catalytic subunit|nr:dihydroorotate dehydrogenase [Spirochaetales bacterium]